MGSNQRATRLHNESFDHFSNAEDPTLVLADAEESPCLVPRKRDVGSSCLRGVRGP